MKKLYETPDLQYVPIEMIDVIMVSTESTIPEVIEPGDGGGGGHSYDDF